MDAPDTLTMPPKKSEEGARPVGVNIKARPEWAAWLKRAADHCGLSLSGLVDQAVRAYVKRRGFDEPAPKR